jgi:hypothetical protein
VRRFDYEGATVENIKVSEAEFERAFHLIEPEVKTALEQAFRSAQHLDLALGRGVEHLLELLQCFKIVFVNTVVHVIDFRI